MRKLKLAYFGTPDLSAWFLEKLLHDKEIPVKVKLVVTQKDKKAGRKQVLMPTPVKEVALKYKIPVLYSAHELKDVDLGLLFAYGEILPKHVLDIPKYGFWNIHPSLLPKYRGPSPVAYPLMEGDKKTGVTLMKMDEKMDHGPIIVQAETEILAKERRPELTQRLSRIGYTLCKRTVKNIGKERFEEQDHSKATYTKLLIKKDGFIEISNFKFQISNSPEKLFNLFRGLYPWPGIWILLRQGKRLKITDMDWESDKLIIKKVQLEGKNEVPYEVFVQAYNLSLT